MNTDEPRSLKRIGHLAGACYLIVGVAAVFGLYHGPLVLADASAMARQLMAMSDLRFRIAVIADVVAVIGVIPMALLFYELFRTIDRRQAALLALLLLVSAPVTFVVLLNYVAARLLLQGAPVVAALSGTEREALGMLFVDLHTWGVMAEEVFWGLWLLPFGYLVIRSGFVPRLLGVLLIIGGVAYLAHSFITLLTGGHRFPLYEQATMLARGAAEFPVMLWLVFKGACSLPDADLQ
jgi:hypothetical protein